VGCLDFGHIIHSLPGSNGNPVCAHPEIGMVPTCKMFPVVHDAANELINNIDNIRFLKVSQPQQK